MIGCPTSRPLGSRPPRGLAPPAPPLVLPVAAHHSAPELPLAARVAAELEDSGLFVKGATSAADGTADRLSLIEGAGVMLLILDSAFEKDKKAKAEFLCVIHRDLFLFF